MSDNLFLHYDTIASTLTDAMSFVSAENNQDEETELSQTEVISRRLTELCLFLKGGVDDPEWTKVRELLTGLKRESHAKQVMENPCGKLSNIALHLVCFKQPPEDVVETMLKISPKSAMCPDREGDLPVHYACLSGASEKVIELLIKAYPESRNVQGGLGNTPLHCLYFQEALPDPVKTRLLATPRALSLKDIEGRTPFDVLVRRMRQSTIEQDFTQNENRYDRDRAKEVLQILLDCEPAGNICQALRSLPSWLLNYVLTHPHVRKGLQDSFAFRFPVSCMFMSFYVHILVLASFCSAVTRYGKYHENAWETYGLRIGVICLVFDETMRLLAMAVMNKLGTWLLMPWTWIDIITIVFISKSLNDVLTPPGYMRFDLAGDESWSNNSDRVILLLTGGLVWVKMISLINQINYPSSMFFSGLVNVAKNLISFVVVVGVLLASFSLMYFMGSRSSEECSEIDAELLTFCTLKQSSLKVYQMLINGRIEEQDFSESRVKMWLSVIFGFLMLILLLNILIAIVVNCFRDSKRSGDLSFWYCRFNLLAKIDMIKNLFAPCAFITRKIRGDEILDENTDTNDSIGNDGQLWENCNAFLKIHSYNSDLFEDSFLRGILSLVISLSSKVVTFLFLIVWVSVGFVTFGLVWPPQVRRWLAGPDGESEEFAFKGSAEDLSIVGEEMSKEVSRMKEKQHESVTKLESALIDLSQKIESLESAMQGNATC